MSTEASDHDLLRRHVDGDAEAFSILVERHRDRLWAVALRTLGDREEAADAVQDAMIKAFRSAASFRGESAVTTWLHRIVVNACLDRARRAAVRRTSALPDDSDRSTLISAQTAPDPAVRREQQVDVVRALQMLPSDQRAALVLVDMEGYSVDEAAQILECPPGTVKSRCSRGRKRLAPLLVEWDPGGRNREHRPTVEHTDRRPTAGGTS